MIEISFHYGWLQSFLALITGMLIVASLWAADEQAQEASMVFGFGALMMAVLSISSSAWGG